MSPNLEFDGVGLRACIFTPSLVPEDLGFNNSRPRRDSINIRRTPSRSSRFWGDWECLSIICAPINFGPPISSQIRACFAAPIDLQNNLVHWGDYSDLDCREASYLRNIVSRDLGHLYYRRLDCNTFLICLWQGGKAVDSDSWGSGYSS